MNRSEILSRIGLKHREKVVANIPLVPLNGTEFGIRVVQHKLIRATESSGDTKGKVRWRTVRVGRIPYQDLVSPIV